MSKTRSDALNVRNLWREARLVPLWESPTAHKAPPSPEQSILWAWEEIQPLIAAALDVTDPAAVERRVLQLMHPNMRDESDEYTVSFIAAAIQILKPGESARPHRHSMNALRFVLEGSGVTTLVDGKECPMAVGDLILTPAWTWHEHRHDGDQPMMWLDVLDVPLHRFLGTAEFDPGPISDPPGTVPDSAFSVPNIVPEIAATAATHSPVFCYPYRDALRALEVAPVAPDGLQRVRYVNPGTGGPAMNILDAHMLRVDTHESLPCTSNASAVCAVANGHGESRIGDQVVRWGPKDIFTLPQGNAVSHRSFDKTADIFVVSNRVALERLGLLKDSCGDAQA